jgi:hypothetical protein
MSKKSRSILGNQSADSGAKAGTYTDGSDPTDKLRTSPDRVDTTPPAPTDQSSTAIDPRRSLKDKISTIGNDGHGPGVSL